MKTAKQYDAMLKLLLIGNSGVGKSCILMQFSQNKFTQHFYNTIGVDYKIKYLDIDNKKVKLQIWDTAGQDRFKTITSSYYRGAHGIIIVYDVTDRESFQNVKNWFSQIQKYAQEKVFKFLVGNKSDLTDRRQVSFKQGEEFAQKLNIPFVQTSAKYSQQINELFLNVGCTIMRSNDVKPIKPSKENIQLLLLQKQKQESNNSCC